MKSAIVFGANGLVGKEILRKLEENPAYSKILVLSRRYVASDNPKIVSEVINFENIHKYWAMISADELYYCLGTTMNQAKSKAKFFHIEYNYCLNIAKIAKHNKIKKFFYISSKGANENSLFYYLKVKGQIEQELKALDFPTLAIFRPWILLGKREQFRFFESIFKFFFSIFNFLFIGPLTHIKGMPAKGLADYVLNTASVVMSGAKIHYNNEIHSYLNNKKKQ
ncbi:MAG: NAD-dependent epimerase/dehydratase family protein [Chitinophagales bacterium]|jgi:uncharacterized protein YbjT (DUF2867 family)|nr:NAD-dependent epimerase/dehydratase family protein [Chitinophagales bacterium]